MVQQLMEWKLRKVRARARFRVSKISTSFLHTHTHTPTHTADMLTAVEFDQTGEYLAAGDRGGTCTNTHTRTHKHARIHKTPTTNDERQVASVSSKPRTRHRNWWLKRRHHSGHHRKRRRKQLWRIISSFM